MKTREEVITDLSDYFRRVKLPSASFVVDYVLRHLAPEGTTKASEPSRPSAPPPPSTDRGTGEGTASAPPKGTPSAPPPDEGGAGGTFTPRAYVPPTGLCACRACTLQEAKRAKAAAEVEASA